MKHKLFHILVDCVTWEQALLEIDRLIASGRASYIVEVNTDVVLKTERDAALCDILRQADLALVDGKPLVWISRWLHCPVPEKISGADLAEELCRVSQRKGYRIFLLGGQPETTQAALRNMEKKYPKARFVGSCSPPWGFERDPKALDAVNRRIREAQPDVLLVCLGCPKQEKWIRENYRICGAKVSLCAGATVDFMAGTVKRAPRWMQNAGLEWFYRFLQEPRRLFRRYFIDDMGILRLLLRCRTREKAALAGRAWEN